MGPIGIPEIIMILLAVVVLAIPISIVSAIVWYFSSRDKSREQDQD